MKKKISLIMALTTLVSMFGAMSASAANVAGRTVNYTETEAFINTRKIESYMVDNHTCIAVDDLVNFGFLYQWDAKARAIYVSTNTIWAGEAWTGQGQPPKGKAIYHFAEAWNDTEAAYKAVTVPNIINNSAYDHLTYATTVPSDVKVYMNGTEVVSYHTGREVLVQLKDLVLAGNGITKFYDPVKNRSWVNVLSTDFNGKVLVELFDNNIHKYPELSTAEAIREANEYLANNYNGLKVKYSNGDEWMAFIPNTVKSTFTFDIIDVNANDETLKIGDVTVDYSKIDQDEVTTDNLSVMQKIYYKK
jgi:hypothetical protein